MITWRRLISFGLIAGLTFEETQNMTPGMVIDLYIMRRDYDDQQHRIKRGED